MAGVRFFIDPPKRGMPMSRRGLAKGIADIARALEGMQVDEGYVDWLNGIPRIVIEGGSGDGGADLPEGGEQYQVLQRDSGGEAVWDWVRAADISEGA